jgi:DnaJ homolog subfamily C member 19
VALLVILAAVLFFVVLATQFYTRTDPKVIARLARYAGATAFGLLALGAAVLDRAGMAVLFASLAWTSFTGGRIWPPRLSIAGAKEPPPQPPKTSSMSKAEALQILGLAAEANADDIRAAHRRLIAQIHPDKGGSDYLAAKINEARDVLLG